MMEPQSPELSETPEVEAPKKKKIRRLSGAALTSREETIRRNSLLPTKRQMDVVMSVQAIRELLETEGRKIVATAPAAREFIHKTITKANEFLDKDTTNTAGNYRQREAERTNDYKLTSIAADSAKLVLQTSGLLPTNMSSVVVNTVLVSSEAVLAPMIARIVVGGVQERKEQEVDITPDPFAIDAEFEETR